MAIGVDAAVAEAEVVHAPAAGARSHRGAHDDVSASFNCGTKAPPPRLARGRKNQLVNGTVSSTGQGGSVALVTAAIDRLRDEMLAEMRRVTEQQLQQHTAQAAVEAALDRIEQRFAASPAVLRHPKQKLGAGATPSTEAALHA